MYNLNKLPNLFVFWLTGIFAYLNYNIPRTKKEILQILIGGLRRLEYRGYDSAGLAIDDQNNKVHFHHEKERKVALLCFQELNNGSFCVYCVCIMKIFIVREVGNVSRLEDLVWKVTNQEQNTVNINAEPSKHTGIAHTRWATHGEVCSLLFRACTFIHFLYIAIQILMLRYFTS